ncbi:hypothetical protein [Roseinatronobacter sp.]|uniref:hypothetical protein n=1 Tax=Roseinatronobacter sp. TaxID=1945755 RepID=UPI003F6FB982
MKTLNIDLSTRILSDKMKVHLVRPGARYAFFRTALEKNVLPVDAPFLRPEDGKPVKAPNKIAAELERARVFRDWARKPEAKRGRIPSKDLGNYSLDLGDASRSATRTRIRNASQNILWAIPGGTLTVIPNRSLSGKAILAKVAPRHEPRTFVHGTGRNQGIVFPARKIFDPKLVPMIDLPGEVLEDARSMKVVQQISGHAEERILRMYYGDYQRAEDHVAGVVAGTDDFDARIIAQMIELHLSMSNAISSGKGSEPGSALFDTESTAEVFFHGRVDSPDGRTYLASTSVITFAVKLMLIVAASGLPMGLAAQAIEAGNVTVINSAEADGAGAHAADTIQASRKALVDFARASGYPTVEAYLSALQDGLNRNSASIAGKATLDE